MQYLQNLNAKIELALAYEEVEKNDERQELLHEWDLIDEQHDK